MPVVRKHLRQGLLSLLYQLFNCQFLPSNHSVQHKTPLYKLPHRNLSDLLEVIHFCLAVVEEVRDQICLDGVHAVLDGLVVLQGFKEFEVEGDNLALDEFCVTILGRQEHKESLMGARPRETTGRMSKGDISFTSCQFFKISKRRSPPSPTSELVEFCGKEEI